MEMLKKTRKKKKEKKWRSERMSVMTIWIIFNNNQQVLLNTWNWNKKIYLYFFFFFFVCLQGVLLVNDIAWLICLFVLSG